MKKHFNQLFVCIVSTVIFANVITAAPSETAFSAAAIDNLLIRAIESEDIVVLVRKADFSSLDYGPAKLSPREKYTIFLSKGAIFSAEVILSARGGPQPGDFIAVRKVMTSNVVFGGFGGDYYLLILDKGLLDADIGKVYSIVGEGDGCRVVYIDVENLDKNLYRGIREVSYRDLNEAWERLVRRLNIGVLSIEKTDQ